MTDVLEAKAPAGTHTVQRRPAITETPVQDDPPLALAQERSQDTIVPFTPVHFPTDSNGNIIDWAREHEFILPALEDQDNAILQALRTHLSSRQRHVVFFVGAGVSLAANALPDVLERLPSYDASIADQRVPGYGLYSARLPGVYQPENSYIRFRSKLIAALLDEPIEDGVTHPGEHVIDEALRTNSLQCRDWLSQALVEHYPTRPSLCASIVRCIGRLDYDRVRGWGMRVANDAIQHKDIEVREAAIRALEAWGGRAALDMLRRHEDTEAWLNEYVQQVIVDLSGAAS